MPNNAVTRKQQVLRDWAKEAGSALESDRAAGWWKLCENEKFREISWPIDETQLAFAAWHRYLLEACATTTTPAEGLLAGFSALRDRSVAAVDLLCSWGTHLPAAMQRVGNPPTIAQDEADVLAGLLYDAAIHQQRQGRPKGKYTASPQAVQTFNAVPTNWNDGRGGASAHVADLLGELGARVCLVNLYHPVQLAKHMRPSANRLFGFDVQGSPRLKPANTPEPDAPLRNSYVSYWRQGDNLGKVMAVATGRAIFRDPRWLGRGQWTTVEFEDTTGTRCTWNWARQPAGGNVVWPWVPGFVTWEVDKTVLRLRFARCEELGKLVKRGYHYLLLSGISVTSPFGKGPPRAQQAFKEQLECLVADGIKIHVEFSGEPDGDTIDPLRRELSGVVTMAGINRGEELKLYTELNGCQFSTSTVGQRLAKAPEVYQAYRRALFLAETLGLERLYVHGTDVDIVLRRNGRPGAMRAEIIADLFAKGMVVVALLQRNYPNDWEQCVRRMPVKFPVNAFVTLFTLIDSMRSYDGLTDSEVKILVEHGYLLPRGDRNYAVGVIPVFWPESILGKIDTTGAGDMTSALSLLYAGP